MPEITYAVSYTPKKAIGVVDLMKHMDLGVDDVVTTDCMSWTTTTKIDKKYIKKMKKAVEDAFSSVGNRVSSVEYLHHRL